jgi:inorganic triphosphatase YgiF
MSSPREIELKLEVLETDVPRLIACPLLKRASETAAKPIRLVSVYFDTDQLNLHQKGLSLRVRRIGRRHVQTIKQESPGNVALFARGEWEHDVATKQPDLGAARDTALAPLLNDKLCHHLKPVFETRVHRKVLQIRRGQSDIEISIDRGKIEAGRKSSPLCEVELELKQGQAADLFKLAKMLAHKVPVQLAVKSKADRGYALLTAEHRLKPCPSRLPPESDVQHAFQIIARACLHQLVANQSLMLAGDAEALHQMRVALRRLRAAISLFSDMLVDPQTGALKRELKWITGELGPAREFEVLLKNVARPIGKRDGDKLGASSISRELQQKRKNALARARVAVESSRFCDLALDTAAWIEAGDWTRNPNDAAGVLRRRSFTAVAAEQLRRPWRKVLNIGKHLDTLDPQHRHKLRIQAKKLRYASEFFAPAFQHQKSTLRRKDFVESLRQLQDALGELNDVAVNQKLLKPLCGGENAPGNKQHGGRIRKASVGHLLEREKVRIAPLLKQAERSYIAFVKLKPFWV